ncbi:integrase catalytic domain-containing protein [Trichonephila inaurata madagascariensis]|uniref:Integrase catalytic domain-containing protein n=1 Tax=Trichonephila inaurata madagascariensis TaxID=2747483 RepID=A0A8X6IMS4_9ARAC|nr:integrase catalytic domain-containing protein [Trichonephila inaurata madagascariensis]
MKFLRQEIESEEKVRLARSGFNLELDNISTCTSASSRRERIPTAAELYNSSENKKESCIFCGKLHFSNHCRYAHNLSYDEKKRILMKKAACFRCFAVKHVFRFCRAKVPPCEFCGKSHYKVMCPEICINENSKNPRQEEKVENENGRDPTLSNATPIRKVLLQTLVVRLRGENKMKYIRVLIDSGSSKSYLTNFAIKEMRYECIAEENLTHSLFGGKETAETHKRYLISLSDFSDKYRCNFEVLNQEIICSGIPRIPRGNFIKEIKKHKIFLSDLNSQVDLLYQFSPDEIHGLIGADVLGKLYTGNIKQLKSDLVLVETRLGWTLMGKTDAGESTDSTNSVMSLHVNDAKISDLWRLDTLGILDPGEKGTRQELEKAAEEHFNRSVKMDSDGRYVVSLPWIQGHPPLPTCRNLAERRLKNCINSLKKTGNLEAYEGVFSEWLQEGVIEESVSSDMKLENLPKIFWSDSADALYWIKGTETWAPFVYNRVKEIRSLTNTEDWYHVPGPLNAADLPSRGCSVETLAMSRWWEGMDWLKGPPEEWPKSNVTPDFDIINSEKRKTVISAANHEGASEEKYSNRFSSYDRLLRVTAWMYRFFTNYKIEKSNRIIGVLTLEEMNRAEIAVLKIVQKESFSGTDDKRLKAIQCYVDPNDDVNDLTPLTPSMFLHDLKQEGIPDLDILDSSSLNKRHAYRQRVKQDLRKRFRTEYLGHLRQSSKFDENQKPLQIGDIVLVSSDNTKRIEWPLAKVMELYPSKDGSIRLVKVKMKSGEFLRPVLRLIPLEVTQKVDLGKPPLDRIFPTNETTVQLTGKECSSETIPDEPDVQRTVNDFSSETVPEKRSRYGRLIKQIVRI